MTLRRLRDGLLLLSGSQHAAASSGSTDDWVNQAIHLVRTAASPAASASFNANGYWEFTATANEELTVADNDAFDPTVTSSFTVLVRGRMTSSSDAFATWITKGGIGTGAGWRIYRVGSNERINAVVSDGTNAQQISTTSEISYDTDHVVCLRRDGATPSTSLFVDGALVSTVVSPALTGSTANSSAVYLGGDSTGTYKLDGRIYDVMATYEALSDAAIAQLSADMVTEPNIITVAETVLRSGPWNITETGAGWGFNAAIDPGDVDTAKLLRHQLRAMRTGDVVPVTWSHDTTFNGWYRIVNPPTVSPVAVYLSTGYMNVQFSLERVESGFASPLYEGQFIASSRSGTTLPTSVLKLARYTLPAGVTSVELDGNLAPANPPAQLSQSRAIDGLRQFVLSSADITTTPQTGTAVYSGPPARALDHRAAIELRQGDVWVPIRGRDLLDGISPNNIRMTTGAFRIVFQADGQVVPEVLLAQGWIPFVTNFEFTIGGASPPFNDRRILPVVFNVLQNTPDSMQIEVECQDSIGLTGSTIPVGYPMTFSYRRGMHHIDILWPNGKRFGPPTNQTATTINTPTVGLKRSADDIYGNRWVIASYEPGVTFDTTRGDINESTAITTAGGLPLMLGVVTDDTDLYESATGVIGSWYSANSETHRLIRA